MGRGGLQGGPVLELNALVLEVGAGHHQSQAHLLSRRFDVEVSP